MLYFIVASITGMLIGMVGIGGILLAPMLVYLADIDLHIAMATSSWSFLFTGIAGTVAYARKGTISWDLVGWLSVGILPATILGARVNLSLQTEFLTIILAALIVFSGINALRKNRTGKRDSFRMSRQLFVTIGVFIGFGSSLTGTGGPVILIPLLLYLNIPALEAIGVSQAIQLPIAVFASAGYFIFGEVDFKLGAVLGIVQAFAVFVGAQIAHKVSTNRLRQLVALALVVAGLSMIVRVLP
jgi:uncharacterized membrane protein YfcA